jgi:hypothetical protein
MIGCDGIDGLSSPAIAVILVGDFKDPPIAGDSH